MERERAAAALRAEQERRQRELAATLSRRNSLWRSGTAGRPARPGRHFTPPLEPPFLAGTPWLAYQCPACQLIGDRRPMMAISGVTPSLSCRWCCANPPFAKLVGLTGESTVAALRKGSKR